MLRPIQMNKDCSRVGSKLCTAQSYKFRGASKPIIQCTILIDMMCPFDVLKFQC